MIAAGERFPGNRPGERGVVPHSLAQRKPDNPTDKDMKSLKTLAVAIGAASLIAAKTDAAVLAHYNFNADTTTFGDAATFKATAASSSLGTAGDATWTGAVVVNTGAFTANVDPNTNHTVSPNGTVATGTTEGGGVRVDHSNSTAFGINPTHYFTFSFTADPAGPGVFLTTLSLDFAHPSTGATAAGFRGFEVQYSVEGGAFASAGWGRLQGHTNSGNRAVNYELDLDDVALADGETVEFRIYKTNANGSGNEVRYDNFMLSGVAIPEPATAGLGLFGALMLVGRRRRA